ncbi:MAG: carboxypeptidase-like regulatory domain-containing protein [Parcubacteria group bacterium]
MKRWKRLILFWSFVTLFLLTVPLVLLRARGYRFDYHRGVFVYSGTLTFKSNPQTVDVRLNGALAASKQLDRINSSYNITGLLPNTYNFQVSADGFQTWSKTVSVHSGLATEFWNILLTRKNYDRINYGATGIEKFFLSPKNNLLVYTVPTAEKTSVSVFDIVAKKMTATFDFAGWSFAGTDRKENIEWSPDSSAFSVPMKNDADGKTTYDYFIVTLADKTQIDLNQFLGKDSISNVRWDPKDNGYLFFLSQNTLYRANLNAKDNLVTIASNVSAYDLSGSTVYYALTPNNLLFKNSLDGRSEPSQITSNFPGKADAKITSMVVYDDSRIAMITDDHTLLIFNQGEHNNYFRELNDGILEAHFSDDGKKLLFWSDNEISVYYLRDELSQPVRNEDTMENITRYSQSVANVQWFYDYEHIVFTVGRFAKIIELDPRDHKNCMDIISTNLENPFMIYNSYLGNLFFTDTQNSSTDLNSIIFPEKPSILGRIGIGG